MQRTSAAVDDHAAVLIALGLCSAKHGDYARPIPRRFIGWAAPLCW